MIRGAFAIDEHTGQLAGGPGTMLDPAVQPSYAITVTARDPAFAIASVAVTITVARAPPPPPTGNGSGGGPLPPAPPRSLLIGRTAAATAVELVGDLLVLRRYDEPGVEVEVAIGWISRDGERIILLGFVRDGDLGRPKRWCGGGSRPTVISSMR